MDLNNIRDGALKDVFTALEEAFDDRPEKRQKDARDIANITGNFFDLQADFIYEHHADLFETIDEEQTLEEISAIVIGREMKTIVAANPQLLARLQVILQSHIDAYDTSTFVRNMVSESESTAKKCAKLLENILRSLTNQAAQ